MTTDKNTLKNWFKTGLKPTQAQFWVWLDSFWHKDEKIPISSIEGIDTALENKAEASALDGKANVDATGLGDANILKWKEALGVGEVPDNMATIDKDGEQGNAYTKEQVDDLLESSGKNMSNAPLTTTAQGSITQGANYTWNTAGFYLNITNLPNKSADATFNQMLVQDANGQTAVSNGKPVLESLLGNILEDKTNDVSFDTYFVYNPTTGKMAKSNKPQIVSHFNMPSNLQVTLTSNIQTIQFTKKPEYSQDLIDALEFIKGIGELNFTKYRSDEMLFHYIQDEDLPEAVKNDAIRKRRVQDLFVSYADGTLTYKGTYGSSYDELYNADYINKMIALDKKSIANVFFNKEMPEDKDWCVSFESTYLSGSGTPNIKIAFSGDIINKNDYHKNASILMYSQFGLTIYKHRLYNANGESFFEKGNDSGTIVWFIKKGNFFITLVQNLKNGEYAINIRNYTPLLKYMYLYLPMFREQSGVNTGVFNLINIKYWIQP